MNRKTKLFTAFVTYYIFFAFVYSFYTLLTDVSVKHAFIYGQSLGISLFFNSVILSPFSGPYQLMMSYPLSILFFVVLSVSTFYVCLKN